MRFLALLLLLVACHSRSQWCVQSLPARSLCFESAELHYKSCDPSCGIDIQFLSSPSSLSTYLQVSSGLITTDTVHVKSGKRHLTFQGEIHKGCQRLSLPPAAQEFFIQALERGQKVSIQMGEYTEVVDGMGFSHAFRQMKHPGPRLPSVKLLLNSFFFLGYDGLKRRHHEQT